MSEFVQEQDLGFDWRRSALASERSAAEAWRSSSMSTVSTQRVEYPARQAAWTMATRLAESGLAQTQHVAPLLGEASVEQLLDDARVELGPEGEVEAIEAFDTAEVRALETALQGDNSCER